MKIKFKYENNDILFIYETLMKSKNKKEKKIMIKIERYRFVFRQE